VVSLCPAPQGETLVVLVETQALVVMSVVLVAPHQVEEMQEEF